MFQRFHKVFQKIYGLRFTLPICWSSQKAASLSPTDRIFHWPSGLPANVGRNDRSLAACTARASSSPTGWNPTNGFPRKWVTLMFGQILLGAGEIFFFLGGGQNFRVPNTTQKNEFKTFRMLRNSKETILRKDGSAKGERLLWRFFFPAGKTKQDAWKEREQTCREEKNELSLVFLVVRPAVYSRLFLWNQLFTPQVSLKLTVRTWNSGVGRWV